MATFGFGRLIERESRRGPVEAPEYGLHIQETWRITRAGAVLLGYGDWHYPPRDSDVAYTDFVERDEKRNRQDDLRDDWIAHGPAAHTVREVTATQAGDLTIVFADRCVLETFVNQSSEGGDGDDGILAIAALSDVRRGATFRRFGTRRSLIVAAKGSSRPAI
jgi:hypothetical protein